MDIKLHIGKHGKGTSVDSTQFKSVVGGLRYLKSFIFKIINLFTSEPSSSLSSLSSTSVRTKWFCQLPTIYQKHYLTYEYTCNIWDIWIQTHICKKNYKFICLYIKKEISSITYSWLSLWYDYIWIWRVWSWLHQKLGIIMIW